MIAHVPDSALRTKEVAPDVHVIELVELLLGHIVKRTPLRDTRVVYQDIQTAEKRRGVLNELHAIVDVAEIGLQEACRASAVLDLLNRAFRPFSAARVVQHNACTLPREFQGNFFAVSQAPLHMGCTITSNVMHHTSRAMAVKGSRHTHGRDVTP
jgi:hypothetical protein